MATTTDGALSLLNITSIALQMEIRLAEDLSLVLFDCGLVGLPRFF